MKASELVGAYIKLRNRKAALKADYDKQVAQVDGALGRIEAVLMAAFQKAGLDSISTADGTAYVSTRTSATVADRDAFLHSFVIPNEAWEFLENRVSKGAVDAFVAEHGDLPPGINYRRDRVINVRKS